MALVYFVLVSLIPPDKVHGGVIFECVLEVLRLHDLIISNSAEGLPIINVFSSSAHCPMNSHSIASQTVLMQNRDLAYAFPLRTPFMDALDMPLRES